MNIFASFRYQLHDQKRGVIIYYLVLVVLCLLVGISVGISSFSNSGHVTVMSGMSSATAIYCFVAALCSFKDNFFLGLQNGVSRRSLFLGRLCTVGVMCAVMAVLDELVTFLSPLLVRVFKSNVESHSLFLQMYPTSVLGDLHPVLISVCSVVFNFALLAVASGIGYLITILFYRLNKLGKILVGAGVPVFIFFGLPALTMLDITLTGGKVFAAIASVIQPIASFAFGQPQNAILSGLVIFAAASGLSWLLMRRATVR